MSTFFSFTIFTIPLLGLVILDLRAGIFRGKPMLFREQGAGTGD
jgi:hypothetical protein